MRFPMMILAVLNAGCATDAGRERAERTVVPGVSPEEVRASAFAVLEEAGLAVKIGADGSVVASTGGGILPRGAYAFASCPTRPYAPIGHRRWAPATGYGVSGTFEVRVRPADVGTELAVAADLTVPECPPTQKRELRRLCRRVSCHASPTLERRIVERVTAEPQPEPFVSLRRAVSAGTTSNRSPTMP